LNGGHYTSLACDTDDLSQWYHFNDSIATPLPPTASVVTKDAYILFYRRTDGNSSGSSSSNGDDTGSSSNSSSSGTKLIGGSPVARGTGAALVMAAKTKGEKGDPVNVPRAAPQLYGGVVPTIEGEWEDSPVLL